MTTYPNMAPEYLMRYPRTGKPISSLPKWVHRWMFQASLIKEGLLTTSNSRSLTQLLDPLVLLGPRYRKAFS